MTNAPSKEAVDEQIKLNLAKNMVLARTVRGWTQEELADSAGVSRATIAQLESGMSDPRLSTVIEIGTALKVDLLLLLIGERELAAIAQLTHDKDTREESKRAQLSVEDIERVRRLLYSGIGRSQKRVAEISLTATKAAGLAAGGAAVGAAIGTLLIPGIGTAIGATLGSLLSYSQNSQKSTVKRPQPKAPL